MSIRVQSNSEAGGHVILYSTLGLFLLFRRDHTHKFDNKGTFTFPDAP